MYSYYKLVCLANPIWLYDEYSKGRIRFGWSWPGSNLLKLQSKQHHQMTKQEKETWRYTQFLLRLNPGDRIVLQFEQPLRRFLIAEVKDTYQYESPEIADFNHIIPCKPLTLDYIEVDSRIVSQSLRHDLTKRGHYYQVYPEEAITELEELIRKQKWLTPEAKERWSQQDEIDMTYNSMIDATINTISTRWKAKGFERFVAALIDKIDGVEVVRLGDSKKGWDLLIRIIDPLSGEVLFEDIPVQCKNYRGKVTANRPVKDLKNCIMNSTSTIAYLFILGELDENFLSEIINLENDLSQSLQRAISLKVVGQKRIAELYLGLKCSL